MRQTSKRILITFTAMLVLLTFSAVSVLHGTIWNSTLAQTAAEQQTLTLTFTSGIGAIYDRNLQPLTGGKTVYTAAVIPSRSSEAALSRALSVEEMHSVYDQMKTAAPFLTKLDVPADSNDVICFPQQQRDADHTLAAHMVGYLDSSGCGISGVEKAFNALLTCGSVTTKITYSVDALRHQLPGETPKVEKTPTGAQTGVVLTLDRSLQKLVEDSAAGLKKGAVVVLEAGTGKILASASLPDFSPNDISAALQSEDGALINRVLQPYNVGSVFKLVSAAAALEHGANPNDKYTCTGSETVDGFAFHCASGEKHGCITMRQAVAQSCNAYFVHLMQSIPPAQFLSMARSLGFGICTEIAPEMVSSSGTLPTSGDLKNKRELANFSFGQGILTATPLQVAAMVNAIASGGLYRQPTIYAGQADSRGKMSVHADSRIPTTVMSRKTAALLTSYMQTCATEGTGTPGRPVHVQAAVKTATAQTGHFTDGQEDLISWYAGFFPANAPRYVVTVMAEGGDSGGRTCGPVFQRIADALYPNEIDKPAK